MTATSVAVWVILSAHVPRTGREAWPSLPRIMGRLGRPDSDVSGAAKAVRLLTETGWLQLRQAHVYGKTHNVYTPLLRPQKGDRRRYVELPAAALDKLAEGRITPAELLALARWIDAGRRDGWTDDSLATFASRWGQTSRTAKTHRARLVAEGLLVTSTTQGKATATFLPGVDPTEEKPSSEPGKEDPQDRGNAIPTNHPPEELPPEEPPESPPAVGGNHVGDARACETAPTARTNHDFQQEASRLLGVMPIVYRQARPWVRRRILAMLAAALADYGPDAIERYAHRHTDPHHAVGSEIPALSRVLQMCLRPDVLAGDACRHCGQDPRESWEPCGTCNPDRGWTEADEAELQAAREFLGVAG